MRRREFIILLGGAALREHPLRLFRPVLPTR
jgi:hypothetical protein